MTLRKTRWDSAPTLNENPTQEAAAATQDAPAQEPAQAEAAEAPPEAPENAAAPATEAPENAGAPAAEAPADGAPEPATTTEIDRNYVKDVHEFLRESDVVKAKVLTIKEDGKIDLSIKAMQDPQPRLQRKRGSDPEFEQKLKRFMRQSEERQVDYKRSVEHKRK